jgi:hypothetical protein
MFGIFDIIRESFLSFFSGSSTTTHRAKHVVRAPGGSSTPPPPKYAGKSAAEIAHVLKQDGGSMAGGIHAAQRKAYFQGKNSEKD